MELGCLERTLWAASTPPQRSGHTRGSKNKRKESLGHVLDSAAVEKGRTCGWVPKWFVGCIGSLFPSPLKVLGKGNCLPLYFKRLWKELHLTRPYSDPFLARAFWFSWVFYPKQFKSVGRVPSLKIHTESKSYTVKQLCTGCWYGENLTQFI